MKDALFVLFIRNDNDDNENGRTSSWWNDFLMLRIEEFWSGITRFSKITKHTIKIKTIYIYKHLC